MRESRKAAFLIISTIMTIVISVAVTSFSDEETIEIPENCAYEKDVECVVVEKKDNTVVSTGESNTESMNSGITLVKTRSHRSSSHRSSHRSSHSSSSSSSKKSRSSSRSKSFSEHFFSRNSYYGRPSHYRHYYPYAHRNNKRTEEDFSYDERYEVTVRYEEENISYTFFSKGIYDGYEIGDKVTMKFYRNSEDVTKSILVPLE